MKFFQCSKCGKKYNSFYNSSICDECGGELVVYQTDEGADIDGSPDTPLQKKESISNESSAGREKSVEQEESGRLSTSYSGTKNNRFIKILIVLCSIVLVILLIMAISHFVKKKSPDITSTITTIKEVEETDFTIEDKSSIKRESESATVADTTETTMAEDTTAVPTTTAPEMSTEKEPETMPAETLPVQLTWSVWSEKLPAFVNSNNYIIETQVLYRSRDLETTSSTKNTMTGWELYNTVTGNGDFGPWSSWSQDSVSKSSTRDVQSEKRYRYCDKETTTSSSSSKSGWNLDNTTYSWGDYGSWSVWSTTAVSNSESRKVESKTQYRYRDISYTTSYTDWSGWSGWQNNSVDSNDLTDVQTRAAYYFYYYLCPRCGAHMHLHSNCYTWANGCGYTGSNFNYGTIHTFYSSVAYSQCSEFKGVGRLYSDNTEEGRAFAWYPGGLDYHDPITQYRYRTRSTTQNQTYGSWSGWSDSVFSSSSTREVETRTVYRYCERNKIAMYHYSRWKDWSPWSTQEVTKTSTRRVENATFYRYRDRVQQTTYYYRRWKDWTNYSTTPAYESDTKQVQTKTQYRYKSK